MLCRPDDNTCWSDQCGCIQCNLRSTVWKKDTVRHSAGFLGSNQHHPIRNPNLMTLQMERYRGMRLTNTWMQFWLFPYALFSFSVVLSRRVNIRDTNRFETGMELHVKCWIKNCAFCSFKVNSRSCPCDIITFNIFSNWRSSAGLYSWSD